MKQFQEYAPFTRASAILGISCYAITALLAACGGDGSMRYMAPSTPIAATPPAASITLSVTPTTVSASTTQTATPAVDAVTAFSQTDLVSSGMVMAGTTDANLRTAQRDET
jgi:hypothetical protein